MLQQNWLIPYPLGFYDNEVFKEELGILTYVQVCRNISFIIDEEMLEESESEDQTLALKTTSVDSTSHGDPDSEEFNSNESHSLVIQTLKLQNPNKRTVM